VVLQPPEVRVHRSLRTALQLVRADRLRWMDEASAVGPLTALRLGPFRAWVLSDAEAARRILVTEATRWARPLTLVVPIRVAVGENLFTQRERAWSRVQPALVPALRKMAVQERLDALDGVIAEQIAAIPRGTTIDLDLATAQLALVVAAWVLLGDRLNPDRARMLAQHQRAMVAWLGRRVGTLSAVVPFAMGSGTVEMRRHTRVLSAYAEEVIGRARTATDNGGVLEALLHGRPSGRPLTARQLRAHVLGLVLAGNDTTAAGLSWALVHGSRHPEAWQRLRNCPDRDQLSFVLETLRLTPPVWGFSRTPTARRATLRVAEREGTIRRNQVLTIYLRAIHRDPGLWRDPLRFDPQRHDRTLADGEHGPLLAFGLGPRGCIGQHLAMAEMTAVLPVLARHGDITIDTPVLEDATFSLRIQGGLTGRFTAPRNTTSAAADRSDVTDPVSPA
jgi:cytochrome P450